MNIYFNSVSFLVSNYLDIISRARYSQIISALVFIVEFIPITFVRSFYSTAEVDIL